MAFFEPDRYFSRISKIDIEHDVIGKGFTHILLDIDNTIFTRDTHEVPRDIGLWLAMARNEGLVFCLISNNWHDGVHELAAKLELPIVSHAVKPLPPAFLIARGKIGAKRETTLVIGDQLITDVLGAHFLGMRAYLVCPLVEQDLKHTLLLRNVERQFISHMQPEGATYGGKKHSESEAPEAASADQRRGRHGKAAGSGIARPAEGGVMAKRQEATSPDRQKGAS